MSEKESYNLLTPDVFTKMRDLEWFEKALAWEYRTTASWYGCITVMSPERLLQLHDIFWDDADVGLEKNLPKGTLSLDQFKLCSYLCFWMRRIQPIREIRPLNTLYERENWLKGEERLPFLLEQFFLYGNEIVAITLAIRLVQYLNLAVAASAKSSVQILSSDVISIDFESILEFSKILKHKNVSAQGINMSLQMLCRVGQYVHRD